MAKELELTDIQREYLAEYQTNKFPIKMHTDPFDGIAFPSLPYNFQMLMSEIDWPKKAEKNPNGTLFAKPQEIDQDTASDIGLQCFGNFNAAQLTGSRNTKKTKKVSETPDEIEQNLQNAAQNPPANESFMNRRNSVIEWLLREDTSDMSGQDIPVKDIKSINTEYETLSTDVIKAISNYITRSITMITPMLQLVAGSGANSAVTKIQKLIVGANKQGVNNIKEWISQNDETLRKSTESELKDRNLELSAKDKARYFLSCISITRLPHGMNKQKYVTRLLGDIDNIKTDKELGEFINTYTNFGSKWDDFYKNPDIKRQRGTNSNKPVVIPEDKIKPVSLDNIGESKEQRRYDGFGRKIKLIKEDVADNDINFDEVNEHIFTILSDEMNNVIGNRADWACMKALEESMKNLKNRADEEIKKRIEIVCKTGGQKSIKHWPLKAEGLLTMWSRYSAELQERIKNRINQLTGTSGSRETGSASMLEDFLRTTYPRIISAMLTYRLVFEQVRMFYQEGLIPEVTADNVEEVIRVTEATLDTEFLLNLDLFDNTVLNVGGPANP